MRGGFGDQVGAQVHPSCPIAIQRLWTDPCRSFALERARRIVEAIGSIPLTSSSPLSVLRVLLVSVEDGAR